jgi:hypothetical protein
MKIKAIIYSFFIVFFIVGNAYANVGLPMITYGFPFMLLLFVPVLVIEAFIYKYKLNKGIWDSFKVASLANLYTTLIGYPISWFLLLIYQIVASILFSGIGKIIPAKLIENQIISFISMPFVMPAWIAPFHNYPVELILYLAGMIGLIPAYWITVSSEKKILRKFWVNEKNLDKICILANKISYLFLFVVIIAGYIYTLLNYK